MEHAGAHDPLLGVTIGNYQVKAKLGEGGMGAVYLAEHPLIGKQVALKVLHPELSANKDVVARFFNEARAVNDIKHPNIVDIIDFGVLPQQGQNAVYFIMEFLEGMSLAGLLRHESRLPTERAFAIAWQIADALGASHAVGIVHRDLKPDNVMVIQRGRQRDFVKVLDFGIAKLTGGRGGSNQTRTGVIMGTPAYMSPEQCEGRSNVDHRTDIYALGILLYKMLTGQVPFHGEGYGEVLVQHITQSPARPSSIHGGISPHVEAVVMKALEKRPDARYQSMEELMKALADPVGYVEANGGLGRFTSGTSPAGTTATPAPAAAASVTPVPGHLQPAPSTHSQQMTTLGSSAGSVTAETRPRSSKAMLIGVGLAALLALAGGGMLLARQGEDPHAASAPVLLGEDPPAGEIVPAPDQGAAARSGDTGGEQPQTGHQGDTVAPAQGTATPAGSPTDDSGNTADVAQVPPSPENVAISIESKPDGAEVFVGTETQPRGKTPLTIELAKSEESVTLTLKRSGYKDRVQQITPREPGQFAWSLSRARQGTRPGDGDKPRRGVDDSVTLQPDF